MNLGVQSVDLALVIGDDDTDFCVERSIVS
jgi:hypothetical protein